MAPEQPTPRRVLVVDDSDDVRGFLRALLRDNGYDVVTAGSGHQALNYLRRAAFDLVILDLVMPDADGRSLVPTVREIDKTVKIIVVAGAAGCLEQSRLAKLGVRHVLPKPFKSHKLLAAAHALTGRGDLHAGRWAAPPPGLGPVGRGAPA
jgi:DNA-binding response OmpR family regulator